jgi:hypothetical protein
MKSTASSSLTNSSQKKKTQDHRRTPSPKSMSPYRGNSASNEVCFSSSAFLNAPDPSSLPFPMFDDNEMFLSVSSEQSTVLSSSKTDTLRQFLNIRSVSATSTL